MPPPRKPQKPRKPPAPPVIALSEDAQVKRAIVEYLEHTPFERAIERPDFRALLEADSQTGRPLYKADSIAALKEARDVRAAKRARPTMKAFFSNKSVLIVPGFMGSQLRDDGANGLIWIDPRLYVNAAEISALKLKPYDDASWDTDADPAVHVRADGAVPVLYAGLRYYLETGRCEVRTAGFDWRKDMDQSAGLLVQQIQAFAGEHPRRPFFLVAHSQGSLVARRALQMLGRDEARRLVNRLILLGPASFGTFSAAFAVAGSHETIESLAGYGVEWPADLTHVLQSMSGLYQLLPWKADTVAMDPAAMTAEAFWETGCDTRRLAQYFGWGRSVDTDFFNDRTSIILGDDPATPAAVAFVGGKLAVTAHAWGDGTVTDGCAVIPGVADVARAAGADHMTLPLNRQVMQTVWRIIEANVTVRSLQAKLPAAAPAPAAAKGGSKAAQAKAEALAKSKAATVPLLPAVDLFDLAGVERPPLVGAEAVLAAEAAAAVQPAKSAATPANRQPTPDGAALAGPPAPPHRRLRVFSFDPLLAANPDAMGTESIVLKLDWDDASADGMKLQPGPVGEYLEVIDFDQASGCFYAPVDLNHPHLLAQDGMPLSETDPQFHQQMVYAVGMATIAEFERALGRAVLWSPRLVRDETGEVVKPAPGATAPPEFVRRLRIYPHAMREPNAYYDPERKALLFGYFPAKTLPGDRAMPNGLVFTCLSYDVVAHEMTHALLDGMHRHLTEPSNPDVLAFHEAFADVVALFQHFSHPAVLRDQVAKAAGRLEKESLLGQLAQQFGEAMGMHKSLRNYLGEYETDKDGRPVLGKDGKPAWKPIKPDPALYETTPEPHDRGAILVAAVFTAFLTIYRHRTRDLMRIASDGTGVVKPGDLHPDLVARLADEAARTARHLLRMAIRALDYMPPVDVTFGEYLRALVTGDIDIVPDDGQLYRVAVVDAFRQWGIYPSDVRTLSVESVVWNPPGGASQRLDLGYFRELLAIGNGSLDIDRGDMYERQRQVCRQMHGWMKERFRANPGLAAEWGLAVAADAPRTLRRGKKPDGAEDPMPKFEVHSVRRCRRVGPDRQERVDILVEVLQKRDGYLREADQAAFDADSPETPEPDFYFRGGATLIIDPRAGRIRYVISKSVVSESRLKARRKFEGGSDGISARANYFGKDSNPFPLLHGSE